MALKLAQYAIVAEERGEKPILLLDDLFDKLDASRVEQLIRIVTGEAFGQIVITDCNPTRLKAILDKIDGEYALFTVGGGAITVERQPGGPTAEEAAPTAAETMEPAETAGEPAPTAGEAGEAASENPSQS